MKKYRVALLLNTILVFAATNLLYGQEKVVRGQITTFDSIPLTGASIEVKSTKETVLSDTLGMFSVQCLPDDRLKVKANGFVNQNVKLKEENRIILVNLKLKPGPENRELAVGYGHVRDRDKLSAVMALNNSDMDFSNYQDIFEAIKGRFPGIQVMGYEIVIRGQNSLYGSSAALLILDGMEVDGSTLASIPTTDIASINVIKDGGAAIYGSRGANGVVIVETKSGGD